MGSRGPVHTDSPARGDTPTVSSLCTRVPRIKTTSDSGYPIDDDDDDQRLQTPPLTPARRPQMLPYILLLLVGSTLAQTPVIGGTCKLGTADVQIGGKQTQFFLKCEATSDSSEGEGVWVVKSRAAASPSTSSASVPSENTQPQQHPKSRKQGSPNICEQDNNARESETCAVTATCLQAHNEFPSSYLQCDQTSMRWTKKSCQEGFLFNFEQQTCIVPKRMSSLSRAPTKPAANPDPNNSTGGGDSRLNPAEEQPTGNSTSSCMACPLGTACRNNTCVRLPASTLCGDGSPPIGSCSTTEQHLSCPRQHFCTAQGACCPLTALQTTSSGCVLPCTAAAMCPFGMLCHDNCCERRRLLRHPPRVAAVDVDSDAMSDDVFAATNDVFDAIAIESFPTMKPMPMDAFEHGTNADQVRMDAKKEAQKFLGSKQTRIAMVAFKPPPTLKTTTAPRRTTHKSTPTTPSTLTSTKTSPSTTSLSRSTTHQESMRLGSRKLPTLANTSMKLRAAPPHHQKFNADPSVHRSRQLFTTTTTSAPSPPSIPPSLTTAPATTAAQPGCDCAPTTPMTTTMRLSLGDSCGGTNAMCSAEGDCPPTFVCDDGCCRLGVCPRTAVAVRFSCTSKYNCRAHETCLFGGCCPETSDSEPMLNSIGGGGGGDEQGVSHTIATPAKREETFTEDQMGFNPYFHGAARTTVRPPEGAPTGCTVDHRVVGCSFDNPCPETSECLDGTCCKQPPAARCGNGLMALAIPATCDVNDECPIASTCQYGRCCPLESVPIPIEKETRDWTDTKTIAKDGKRTNKVRKGKNKLIEFPEEEADHSAEIAASGATSAGGGFSLPKASCLSSQTCDVRTLCPPQFTCSLAGKCCKLDVRCPDGTVPETVCDTLASICPSASHVCLALETQLNACCAVIRGQQASGLVCTYSSCSNSNPCSSGTCNNGYCCSSSSNQAPAIIPRASTGNTSTTNATHAKKTNKPKSKKPSKSKRGSKVVDKDDVLRLPAADFPVGPPGYGFPEHLADLDHVLVKASGDGYACAGGFSSSLLCSVAAECPPGLHCDRELGLCCPLLLPLTDAANPSKPGERRKHRKEQSASSAIGGDVATTPSRLHFGSYPCNSPCFSSSNNNNCAGCGSNNSPQIITIPSSSCPGGGYSQGSCNSGYCATGYSCIQNQCCPSYSAPQISVFTCPSGGNSVGNCIQGQCASGYSCQNNACCPSTTTLNPFVCPDGTQAAGGCVNGACGTGYTCTNGLCCTGTSSTVRCLDGTAAVGACIPSCTGNACGGSQLTFYCGTGYTCTTGNICCAINSCPNGGTLLGPAVNGLCPVGFTVQNGVCCSSACPDGSAGTPAVNNVCPTGATLTNGVCCTTPVTCDVALSNGPCLGGTAFNGGCTPGFSCDTNGVNCCPVVAFNDQTQWIGPGMGGQCPPGFVLVMVPNNPFIVNGVNPGVCVDIQSVPGLCAAASQGGPCNQDTATGTCATGFTCFTTAGLCCSNTMLTMSRLRGNYILPSARNPVFNTPLESYMPPRPTANDACGDGTLSAGPCMNGLCGVGLECRYGQCCQPTSVSVGPKLKSSCPSGETAVSGCFANGSCGMGLECVRSSNLCCPPGQPEPPAQVISPRPIGARCHVDAECVGQMEGLSMCHAGVCQCSPIAYSQGIACVRRKSFQMNDAPAVDVENTNEVVKTKKTA